MLTRAIVGRGGGGSSEPASQFEAAHGHSASSHWLGPVGQCIGETNGFGSSVMYRLRRIPTGREIVFGAFKRFADCGWASAVESARFQMWVHQQADSQPFGNFTDGNLPADTEAIAAIGKLIVQTFVYTGTVMRLFINGELCDERTPNGGIIVTAGRRLGLGIDSADLAEPAASCEILGAVYTTGVPTADEVADHALDCMEIDAMSDAGHAWTNWWTLDGLDALPSTLEDQIGSVDLTLVGSGLVLATKKVPGYL